MKKLLIATTLAFSALSSAQAAPSYVGSFNVFDGPVWTSNPQAISGRQAAALIFGGSASDYAISVNSSLDPNTITNTAWLDGWGDEQYLLTPTDDDFFLSSRVDGGYDTSPAFSAYVCDHANCTAYGNPVSSGTPGYNYTNYVWRLDPTNSVPEPASMALVGLGVMGLAAARRRTL